MYMSIEFTTVVLVEAIAVASIVLEFGIINGSQGQSGQTHSAPRLLSSTSATPPPPTSSSISPQEKIKTM
jgi:hypothetical protein